MVAHFLGVGSAPFFVSMLKLILRNLNDIIASKLGALVCEWIRVYKFFNVALHQRAPRLLARNFVRRNVYF